MFNTQSLILIMKKIFFISLLAIMILVPSITLAARTGIGAALGNLETVNQDTGLEKDLSTSLGTVVKTALSLVGTIFLGLMIYAGILWMTAQGNDYKVQKAKDIIIAAIIGVAVTMSAYAITYFVTARLSGVGGVGGGGGEGKNEEERAEIIEGRTCCLYWDLEKYDSAREADSLNDLRQEEGLEDEEQCGETAENVLNGADEDADWEFYDDGRSCNNIITNLD